VGNRLNHANRELTVKHEPITVLTYHRNGEIVETQWRTMQEAYDYMDLAMRRNTVAECEYYS
jgi:hypothetical protein